MFVTLKVCTSYEFAYVLQNELAQIGFDSFLEEEDGCFLTSIDAEAFNQESVEAVFAQYTDLVPITFQTQTIAKQNWNTAWEANYPAVEIAQRCIIRAEFHQIDKKYDLEIIITPKMSFGTGHHETTWLMVSNLLDTDLKGKTIADAGCGTGILAIAALKLGAASAQCCDIEEWAVENTQENAQNNHVSNLTVTLGTVDTFTQNNFDVFIANINLNVLLAELPKYTQLTAPKGLLLLSGFYDFDADKLIAATQTLGFELLKQNNKNGWCALVLQKIH